MSTHAQAGSFVEAFFDDGAKERKVIGWAGYGNPNPLTFVSIQHFVELARRWRRDRRDPAEVCLHSSEKDCEAFSFNGRSFMEYVVFVLDVSAALGVDVAVIERRRSAAEDDAEIRVRD